MSALLGAHACSGAAGSEGIRALVEFDPAALQSRCVKVFATEAGATRETAPIALAGQASPLRVAIFASPGATVRVWARGFLDEACTTDAPGEVSDAVDVMAGNPATDVTLRLAPSARADGGAGGGDGGLDDGGLDDGGAGDAGTEDGGTDAGFDAGLDLDDDGVPQPEDCDDANPQVKPGAPEVCFNALDDDCDQQADCLESACALQTCMGGGVCRDGGCVAATEVLCADGFDNDLDGLTDCLDPDCPFGASCSDFNGCTLGDHCEADGGCAATGDKACTTPPGSCFSPVGVCLPDAGAACSYTPRAGTCDDGLACTDNDTCTAGSCAGAAKECPATANACLSPTGVCQEPTATCTWAPLPSGPCDDGQNCTVNDGCDGDGGCAGTPVVCTAPTECHGVTGTCEADGGCIFFPQTGVICDGGAGREGLCTAGYACQPSYVSCLDLFEAQPSTPTGNYAIDPDRPSGTNAPFTVRCEMAADDAGWTVMDFDDFSVDAGGWSDTRRDTSSSCFTAWGAMLGGYNLFGNGMGVSKNYLLRQVPHTQAQVELDYFIIDSWDNEAARVSVDGTYIFNTNFTFGGGTNVCGAAWQDRGPQRVSGVVAHSTDSLIISVTSTLNEAVSNESFGIDNVKLLLR